MCELELGNRAPVVVSVTPSSGDCRVAQDLLITGGCFILNTPTGPVVNVTSVFAVQSGNPANVIFANPVVVFNANELDAFFNFGTANNGRTFFIFVAGPNGTSRNLMSPVAGAPAGCALGNEFGVQVTFTCDAGAGQQPCPPNSTPEQCPCQPGDQRPACQAPNIAVLNSCDLGRNARGNFRLIINGSNIRNNATVTISGQAPNRVVFKQQQSNGTFNRIIARGGICGLIPGPVVVTNPGAAPSAALQCNEDCPTQQ
ncbi:MAG TPA: hypothetical protein VNO70_04695 [Blastocatellia bacterium]|nr:hypothetical protein [Blastocatellia bacterium]